MRTGALLFVLGAWAAAQGADISVRGGVLRVEKNSQVRMTDDLIELTSGTITYQVQDPDAAQVAILTPSVSLKAGAEGVYRIAVRKTGESEITAQSGRMVVMAPGGEQWLEAGQKMIARGPRVNPEFRIVSALAWWKRLASLLQNMQIGGGVSVEAGGGGEEQAATVKETRTKPNSENTAVPSGSAHSGEDRPKTSDGHSNTGGGSAHSGDSRPNTSSGSASASHSSESHAAPAPAAGNSHSSGSHAAPASSGGGHSNESHAAPAASGSHSSESHAAPPPAASSSHSSESHAAAPASSSSGSHSSDNAAKGK